MYCSNCGAQIADDSEFCSNCGARQKKKNGTKKIIWIIVGAAVTLTLLIGVVFAVLAVKFIRNATESTREFISQTEETEETIQEEPIREEVPEEPVREEPEPEPELSSEEEFEQTMQGAWVYCNEDRADIFFRIFDGTGVIRCGYVESELMPSETIDRVLEAEDDHYKVEVTQEAWYYDFDSDEMTPEQTVTLDLYSEGDLFQSLFYIKNDDKKFYFVKMDKDFDERFYDHKIFDQYRAVVDHYLLEAGQ